MATPRKPKEIYRERYRRGGFIRQDLLPKRFPFTSNGWEVESIEVMAAGDLEDGREFQEIRIYTRELPPAKPDLVDDLGDPISARDVAILGGDPSL